MDTEYIVIVESPSKTKNIEKYLNQIGNGSYKVVASKGHICSITGLKSIGKNYEIDFTKIPTKIGHIQEIGRLVRLYSKDCVIIATDNDREGEAIGYHLCREFGLPIEKTKRILFNEITPNAIKQAVLHPVTLNMDMIRSQNARQVLDIFIGFKISPLLWKYVYSSKSKSLSAGRCQTPALRLIYDNYLESLESNHQVKYKCLGTFFDSFSLKFQLSPELKAVDEIEEFLGKSSGFSYHIESITKKNNSKRSAPLPLNTSRLLQYGNNGLHISPKMCMNLAQKLYQDGLITYHRTESKKYCKDFLTKIQAFIVSQFNDSKYIHENISTISNEHDALPHEAIRVTDIHKRGIETTDSKLNALYKFIWTNTVESCMASATFEVHQIELNTAMEKYKFVHVLEIPIFLGWMRLCGSGGGVDTGAGAGVLSFLRSVSGTFPHKMIEVNTEVSGLHSHYTESGLIKKLEDLGIGRPSTYAMFVETIQERGYVKKCDIEGLKMICKQYKLVKRGNVDKLEITEKEQTFGNEKGKLKIESLGILCIEFLLKYFDDLFHYSYTSNIEQELDKIRDISVGEEAWYSICEKVKKDISLKTKAIQQLQKINYPINEEYDLVFQSFGLCGRRKVGMEFELLPIHPNVKIDIQALLRNEKIDINLENLFVYSSSYLGTYGDDSVYIRTGTYGHYLACGETQKSLKDYSIDELKHIDVEKAVEILFGGGGCGEGEIEKNTNSNILRILTPQMSIRNGKFGPYVYYLKEKQKTPSFINLKSFKEDYMTCDVNLLVAWAIEQSNKPKPVRRFFKKGSGKK